MITLSNKVVGIAATNVFSAAPTAVLPVPAVKAATAVFVALVAPFQNLLSVSAAIVAATPPFKTTCPNSSLTMFHAPGFIERLKRAERKSSLLNLSMYSHLTGVT